MKTKTLFRKLIQDNPIEQRHCIDRRDGHCVAERECSATRQRL
jgi:hypothetical protein